MRRAHAITFLIVVAALLSFRPALAQVQPRLDAIRPCGVKRGGDRVLELTGLRLQDPLELFFYDEGIEVLRLEAVKPRVVRAHVRIADSARPGSYRARLLTKGGWTAVRLVQVGVMSEVPEKEPNGLPGEEQELSLGVTVNGVLQREDQDRFAIDLTEGQRVSLEVEGMRLGVSMLDPRLELIGPDGVRLAVCDDTALLRQDPYLNLVAPRSGRYVITLEDSAHGGGRSGCYRLHVGAFPRPAVVYPAGARPGRTVAVEFRGDAGGLILQEIGIPQHARGRWPVTCRQGGGLTPSPLYMRIVDIPATREREPNKTRKQATSCGKRIPFGADGCIERPGDADLFAFEGRKDQRIIIRVFARELGSPLDPELGLYRADGRQLAAADDGAGLDSVLRARLPRNGRYFLQVRDRLDRGSLLHTYRVEVHPDAARLAVSIQRVRRFDSQSRQWAAVPRGNRALTLVRTTRVRCGGELELACANLPQGVTLQAPRVRREVSRVPVVFQAAADAPLGGGIEELRARHVKKPGITGVFRQRVDLVLGNPNNAPYFSTTVVGLPVAVTRPVPFAVDLDQPAVPLLLRGRMLLKVRVKRARGFKAGVRVRLPFRPPGVGASSSVMVPAGRSEASYTISASSRATTGRWPLAVEASAAVPGGGTAWVSSQPRRLEIRRRFFSGSIPMAVAVRGSTVQVVCKLTPVTSLDGTAEVALLGLPRGCKTTRQTIDGKSREVVFTVKTSSKTPLGRHRSLFCRLSHARSDGTLNHTLGGTGTLRIDRASKGDAKPAPAAGPRLSRLEQLRRAERARRGTRQGPGKDSRESGS